MPAASDTKVRTSGMKRPKNTKESPRRVNHASARSRSWLVNRMYLPNFSTSGRPPAFPMA